MKDISRREAISRIAGGAGLALSLSGNELVRGEELERTGQQASSPQGMTARAFAVNISLSRCHLIHPN